jgi:hypothetical protein
MFGIILFGPLNGSSLVEPPSYGLMILPTTCVPENVKGCQRGSGSKKAILICSGETKCQNLSTADSCSVFPVRRRTRCMSFNLNIHIIQFHGQILLYISAVPVHRATESGRRSNRMWGVEKLMLICDLPRISFTSMKLERDSNP